MDKLRYLSVLPAGETVGQWVGFDRGAIVTAVCILLGLLVSFCKEKASSRTHMDAGRGSLSVSDAVGYALILAGGTQAVWGLMQLYGCAASRHSLYAMTGSFFNPGPYSGYLAMALPVCLHQWLTGGGMSKRVSGAAMLLILCVLPAGMSRSAWLAAAVSCLWVYGCRAGWKVRLLGWWQEHRLPAAATAISAGCLLLLACVLGESRREWLVVALLAGCIGGLRLKTDVQTEQACREWVNARVLYHAGAYRSAEQAYERLYPLLGNRAHFLFEYGHGLHKQQKPEESNRILKEALRHSSDPMILNVIGKNYQEMGDYQAAEVWFLRSTHRLPGRIYPYYLLAKLYAEPSFRQPDKLEAMKRMVLTKEPKVHSTAIRQMREEVKKLCNDKEE